MIWCPGRDLNPHFPFEKTDFKTAARPSVAVLSETYGSTFHPVRRIPGASL
jgi:hypothetical protein